MSQESTVSLPATSVEREPFVAPPSPVPSTTEAATLARRLHWLLRVGVAACFIGHGAFGILTKEEWVPYFGVVGIAPDRAFGLMPVVGTIDILAGVIALVSPRPVVLLYMAAWGLWTALLRPLSGDSIWETVERAGNYGVPFALLLLAGGRAALADWLAPIQARAEPEARLRSILNVLTWVTALLLAGHGALGAIQEKALLTGHYVVIGLPAEMVRLVGWFEMALAVAILRRPRAGLFAFVFCWKITTELLFPLTGAPIWEFIERGGSYAAPAAAALLLTHLTRLERGNGDIP
jgi:hypothetical protein